MSGVAGKLICYCDVKDLNSRNVQLFTVFIHRHMSCAENFIKPHMTAVQQFETAPHYLENGRLQSAIVQCILYTAHMCDQCQ